MPGLQETDPNEMGSPIFPPPADVSVEFAESSAGLTVAAPAGGAKPSRPPGLRGLWTWFEQGHWLGKWHSPALVKIWRYGAGSAIAFVSSGVALFVCIQWLGLGATTSAVIAFLAGAVPNWVLNRRWAWQKRHREGIGHETTLYVIVSLISLGVSVGVTKATAVGAAHIQTHPIVRHLLVVGMYLLATVALAGAKYVAYDRWVFVERRRERSRAQVRSTTELNLKP